MRRPDVFTLDYSHPLAQGLVFAGVGQMPGSARYHDGSLTRAHGTAVSYPAGLWGFDETLQRPVLRWPSTNTASYFDFAGLLPSFTGAFWVSAWVLSTGADWANHGIFRADNGSAESNIYLIQSGGSPSKWRFRTEVIYSGVNVDSDDRVAANVWQHLIAQRDGAGVLSLHVSGSKQSGTATKNGTVQTTRAAVGYNYVTATYAKCLIADVVVGQGRTLSPSEIAILADRTDPMLGGLIVEERPVLYFDMGVSTVDALTASNLTISAPVLGTPSLGQVHALTAAGITVEGPVLGAPTLAQIHALMSSGLTTSAPAMGTPTLTENAPTVDNLTVESLVVGSPVLGTPNISQVHALTSTGLTVSAPVLGTPALVDNGTPIDALTASELTVGSPVLGTPSLGQAHVLGSDGLVTGSPVLGLPIVRQIHTITALGLTIGAPTIGTPELNKTTIDLDITANLSSVGLDVMYLDSIGTFTAQLTSSGCKLVTLRSVGNFEVAEREE